MISDSLQETNPRLLDLWQRMWCLDNHVSMTKRAKAGILLYFGVMELIDPLLDYRTSEMSKTGRGIFEKLMN